LEYGNLEIDSLADKEALLMEQLQTMKSQNKPIKVVLDENKVNYIFYKDSKLLTQLQYFPIFQFIVIGLFLIIAYYLFSTARKSEQNQVWVGMAKETAHQLGTPLSSLIAWVEYLKTKDIDSKLIDELTKDIDRLEMITERFSKIGSVPKLEQTSVYDIIEKTVNYLKSRISGNVTIDIHAPKNGETTALMNASLFSWVLENLIKNAVDAMEGKGAINIHIIDQVQYVYIDISDTGKGISKKNFKTIFEPGYTTKQRGWGLGLSLVKRIIENYHSGKIFVKNSSPHGTTFRIVLKK
jgi:signal transduction histidine kinase